MEVWGTHTKQDVHVIIDASYDEIVFWRRKEFILLEHIGIEGTRYCSEISLTRTVLTA